LSLKETGAGEQPAEADIAEQALDIPMLKDRQKSKW